MKIRVGRIPYLNSEPFYFKLNSSRIELVSLVPSALFKAIETGDIQAGPLPVVDVLRLGKQYEELGPYCIATVDKARSILLYSKSSIENLSGTEIGVTHETSTSRKLLEVLLTYRFGVCQANYVGLHDQNNAFLLIGDSALKYRHGVDGYPFMYDLGEEWTNWTGLPFVFAQWIIDTSVDKALSEHLRDVIFECMENGLADINEIYRLRYDMGMELSEIEDYYSSFNFQVGVLERKAISLFNSYLTSIAAGKKG